MIIRRFRVADEAALHEEFVAAIHQGLLPIVVETEGKIIAYADVQSNGYIDHLVEVEILSNRQCPLASNLKRAQGQSSAFRYG